MRIFDSSITTKDMKIQVGKIEGATSKKGSKQNKIYNCEPSETNNWFNSDCGKKTIWNVDGDWSTIGICTRGGRMRMSYTKDFKIIEN